MKPSEPVNCASSGAAPGFRVPRRDESKRASSDFRQEDQDRRALQESRDVPERHRCGAGRSLDRRTEVRQRRVDRLGRQASQDGDNSIWLVTGLADGSAGLIQYDAATGRTLSTAQFAKADSDPHGLAWYNGALYSSDAGIHPGWQDDVSPTHGYIFRIDFI